MNKNDKLIRDLISVINQKKQEITKLERPDFKTNLSYRFDENSPSVNLHTKNLEDLIIIYSHLLMKKDYFDKAIEKAEVKLKFSYYGFSFEEWESDILTLTKMKNISKIKSYLKEKEELLQTLVSPEELKRLEEERKAKKLEQIANELKDI